MFDTIFIRRSIRKYDPTPLSPAVLQGFEEYAKTIKPLNDNMETQILLLEKKDMVSSPSLVNAPYFFVFCARKKTDGYLENIGYMAQHMALFLHKEGYGCCFSGMAHLKKQVTLSLSLDPVLVLAFGSATACIDRLAIHAKRKPINEIYSGAQFTSVIEAVRLAPSALNLQPWFFSDRGVVIDVYRVINHRFLKALMKTRTRIDVGIALCHLCIAAEHYGYTPAPVLLSNRRFIGNKTHAATVSLLKI